jgi:hypothetical protein
VGTGQTTVWGTWLWQQATVAKAGLPATVTVKKTLRGEKQKQEEKKPLD